MHQTAFFARLGHGHLFRFAQRPQAFGKHQAANDTQKQHVAQFDQEIDLAQTFEVIEHNHTKRRTDQPANEQHPAHFEIHRFAFHMRQNAREGGGHDLIGFCGDGHRRGDADEKQKRCHQKATANAEHARKNPHQPAEPQQDKGIHRDFSNGQIDIHGAA